MTGVGASAVTGPVRYLWLLLAAAVLGGCSGETARLQKGEPAPAFELPRLGGKPLAFPSATRGQVVAIRFWADWCPYCESEMRDIEPVYLGYRDRGLRILAVNVRQDGQTASKFLQRLDVSYDVLLDRDGSVARRYGVIGLPSTFFVDRSGKLGARILGESTPEIFERIVRELL